MTVVKSKKTCTLLCIYIHIYMHIYIHKCLAEHKFKRTTKEPFSSSERHAKKLRFRRYERVRTGNYIAAAAECAYNEKDTKTTINDTMLLKVQSSRRSFPYDSILLIEWEETATTKCETYRYSYSQKALAQTSWRQADAN